MPTFSSAKADIEKPSRNLKNCIIDLGEIDHFRCEFSYLEKFLGNLKIRVERKITRNRLG